MLRAQFQFNDMYNISQSFVPYAFEQQKNFPTLSYPLFIQNVSTSIVRFTLCSHIKVVNGFVYHVYTHNDIIEQRC